MGFFNKVRSALGLNAPSKEKIILEEYDTQIISNVMAWADEKEQIEKLLMALRQVNQTNPLTAAVMAKIEQCYPHLETMAESEHLSDEWAGAYAEALKAMNENMDRVLAEQEEDSKQLDELIV